MRRLCERPGCTGAVSASYGIDNARLVVWLDSAPSPDPALAGSLCRRHADALIVPKGWRIDDRREEIPRLFPAIEIEESTEHTPSAGVRKRATKQSEQVPSLFDAAATPVTQDASPTEVVESIETDTHGAPEELEETRAIPWMPRIVSRQSTDDSPPDDLEDSETSDATPAQGRLLRRAFGDRNVR